MIDVHTFDDIRPYEDHEVGALVEKVLKLNFYSTLIRRFFPGKDPDMLKMAFLRINSIFDFQINVIYPILKKLTPKSCVASYGKKNRTWFLPVLSAMDRIRHEEFFMKTA